MLAGQADTQIRKFDVLVAITLVHEKRPIRLNELLHADDSNFIHDVFGILRHINTETGELQDCFVPRFSVPE